MTRPVKIKSEASALYKKAVELAEAEKIEDAMNNLREAMSISSDFSTAICELGNCYDRLNKLDEAIEHYDKAIGVDPYHADAWYNKGQALIKKGNCSEGEQCISKAIDLYLGR